MQVERALEVVRLVVRAGVRDASPRSRRNENYSGHEMRIDYAAEYVGNSVAEKTASTSKALSMLGPAQVLVSLLYDTRTFIVV